ncbi:hypothetical protein JTB14_000826 [Gonioctena quinquepunctata]|nr:hypothetical protein JTB14_000826 [Gonioctena quinquepunctata]
MASVRFADDELTESATCSIALTDVRSSIRKSRIMENKEVMDFYRSLFDSCDSNGDGVICVNELKKFIETEERRDITDQMAEIIYLEFDKNKDQKLDFEEFLEMINSSKMRRSFRNISKKILDFITVTPDGKKIALSRTLTRTGEYEKNFKLKKTTIRMLVLSLTQILFYYIDKTYQFGDKCGPYREFLRFDPCRKFELYRYLTYAFVHTTPTHLYPNVIIQLIVGVPLETIHTWRVLIVYFFGVLMGSLAHSVMHREYSLVGASGGVYSVLTVPIAAVILNWRDMSHPAIHMLFFGTIAALDVGVKYYNFSVNEVKSKVSLGAHLGGAVVGLLFGVNIIKNIRESKIERVIWYICWVILVAFSMNLIIMDASLPLPDDCFNMTNTTCTIPKEEIE